MNAYISRNTSVNKFVRKIRLQRGLAFGAIIIAALLAFEIFNFSTTEFALRDLLGDLSFANVRWATILAIAFCGIDFAGIARLFTPEEGANEPTEVWYLFGAWLLAATMNAMLTWWGVSIALIHHQTLGNEVIARELLLRGVPIFVAIMVWLIRVLIIGTFSVAGDRLFSQADIRMMPSSAGAQLPARSLNPKALAPSARPTASMSPQPPKKNSSRSEPYSEPAYTNSRPEPTYHPATMSAKPYNRSSTPFRR
jgi:hypothetical protein